MNKVQPEPIPLKIATFNCKNLSVNDQSKLQGIAAAILHADPDMCALQEINNLQCLPQLLALLDTNIYGEIHDTRAINTNHKIQEFMAFIYKKATVTPIGCTTFTQQEKLQYVGQGKLMLRAPVYARFIINALNTDVVIISYHTNQQNPMYDCLRIHQNIDAIKQTNSCNSIIFLGDFNTSCNDKHAFHKVQKRGYMPSLPHDQFTNLTNTAQYDNIWYHPDSVYINQPAKVFREFTEYSDHCLIMGEFMMKKPISNNAYMFNPPSMTEVLYKKKSILKLISIPCCSKTQITCDCRYE